MFLIFLLQTKKNKVKSCDLEKIENEVKSIMEEEKEDSKFEESKDCRDYVIKNEEETN